MAVNLLRQIYPAPCQENISVNDEIIVRFLEPMDTDTIIQANISLLKTSNYNKLDISLSYDESDYTLTITPDDPLEPLTTYHVILRGESENVSSVADVNEGLKSVLGSSMFGDYNWTFTTGNSTILDKPVLTYPSDRVSTTDNPTFNWNEVADAVSYNILISDVSTFTNEIYEGDSTVCNISLPFVLEDLKEYWWKVQAVDAHDTLGPWSEARSFFKGDLTVGKVSAYDSEVTFPYVENIINTTRTEVLNVYPPSGESAVGLNLPYVAVQFRGHVPASKINSNTFKLIGEPYTKKSSALQGQSWWINSMVASPVQFTKSQNVADKMRAITTHGEVPLRYIVTYDPAEDVTTVIGVITDKNTNTTSISQKDMLTETYSRENLIGSQDGVNTIFYTPTIPLTGSLKLYKNGDLFTDYLLENNKITFASAPAKSDSIETVYRSGYSITEKPIGTYNGANSVFTTTYVPVDSSFKLYDYTLKELTRNVDYTLLGNTITMVTPPSRLISSYEVTLPFIINEVPSGTVDGSNLVFSLSNIPYEGSEQIYKNGKYLDPTDDYTIDGADITYDVAPTTNDVIICEYFISNPYIVGEIPTGTIDGTNKIFTLTNEPAQQTLEVYVNGSLVNKSLYTVSLKQITFTTAPALDSVIKTKYQIEEQFEFPIPEANEINHLVPNNRYYILCTIDQLDGKYMSAFTSQYWPLFANIEDIKLDLLGIMDMTDDQLYAFTRDMSIQATHFQTSAMHYLIETTMSLYENDGYDLPFDPNSPTYCVYMYVRYKVGYMILLRLLSQTAINGAGRKKLGDLEISKGSAPIALQPLLQEIKDNLKLWEDAVKGITGRGEAHMAWAVRGSSNSNQYSNDYPIRTRLFAPNVSVPTWWRNNL